MGPQATERTQLVADVAGPRVGPELDATTLEAFVAIHYGRLIRLAALVCRSTADAEDAVQAALERAWRMRTRLEDMGRLRPWLDRIVVREAVRLAARRPTVVEISLDSVPDVDVSRPDRTQSATAVRLALAQLAPAQRAAVVLHLYAGYSVADSAEILGVPPETLRSRLRVARGVLRRVLGEER